MSIKGRSELDLNEEENLILKEFRSSVKDVLKSNQDDQFLLRWLRARNFDPTKAEKMLRESVKFRKKIEADKLFTNEYQLPEVFKKYVLTNFVGYDKEGSPVRTHLGGVCDYKGLAYSLHVVDLMKAIIYLLEGDYIKALENKEKKGYGDERSIYIADLQGFNFRQFYDKRVVNVGIILIRMYQDNFPELLKVCYLVNAPPIFTWVFNIFKPFIDDRTLRKIRIHNAHNWKNELLKTIDPKILPANLGGEVLNPDEDPKLLMKGRMKVPTSCYLKEYFSLPVDDPNARLIVIRERANFDYELDIKKSGTIIRWLFQTKDCNLRFGLLYKDEDSEKPPEEILSVKSVDCHILPEKGSIVCERTGQYILHFQNEYSWFTSKQLLLFVEKEEPETSATETQNTAYIETC